MSKLIRTFTAIPKELFRLNNGSSVLLRDRNVKPTGSYDLVTVDGKVKPKALDPKSYAAPNGASLRPNTTTQNRLVHSSKGSDLVVYAIPAGIQLPGDLVLVHERSDHYSLQAAKEMSLQGTSNHEAQRPTLLKEKDVNTKITNFLNTHAEKLTKDQWLKKYPKPTERAKERKSAL